MASSRFEFTDEARPLVQLGLGDTRIPQAAASSWDTARWEDYAGADARWAGTEPFWLDVSCFAHEAELVSGRERFVDRWQPGTASVTFTNEDGWADLAGTPGSIASLSLRPGRAIRIGVELATLGVVWLWRGIVDSTMPAYDPVLHDTVIVNAIDVLGDVGSTKLTELAPDGADELVHVRIGRILDTCKFEATKRILAASTTKVIPTTMGEQAIDLLGLTADSSGGVVFSDIDGNIVYKNLGWQAYPTGTAPNGTIGNVAKGTPAIPAQINPAYVHAPGPPTTDVSTPDAGSLAIPNRFTVFTETRQPLGAAAASVCLCGQMDGALREWVILRDQDDGDWGFGTSLDGNNVPVLPVFTSNGATPITGVIERFALSVKLDDGIGMTMPALIPATGVATTPDQVTFTLGATLYVFALVRCDDVDAAGIHTIAGQQNVGASGVSWGLQINAGTMQMRVSANGVTATNYPVANVATLGAVLIDGQDQYIGASIQFTTTPGNARTALLTSGDGTNWVEHVSTAVSGAIGQPFNSTAVVTVGARGDSSNRWAGRIYWARAYTDGTDASNLDWWFNGADNTDEDALVYTDPRGLEWTLSAAGALDRMAVMRSTSLQAFKPSPYPGGPRWLPVEGPRQFPKMLYTDRASPVRIGAYLNGGTQQQVWNGDIMSVELVDGGDPNLPGQTIWRMDLDDSTEVVTPALIPSLGIASTPDNAAYHTTDFHILAKVAKASVTDTVLQDIASQWTTGQQGWRLAMQNNGGVLRAILNFTTGGVAPSLGTTSSAGTPTIVAGTPCYVGKGVVFTGGNYIERLFRSIDGEAWTTTLGSTNTAGTLHNSTAAVQIGTELTGATRFDGLIYWVEMRTGQVPGQGTLLWRFDASEYPGFGTSFVDPRGKTWTLSSGFAVWTASTWTDVRARTWTVNGSPANVIDPPDVPGVAAIPGDVCPTEWSTSFDRSEIATQVILNRQLPAVIPLLRYSFTAAVGGVPAAGELCLGEAGDQTAIHYLNISATTFDGLAARPYLRNLRAGDQIRLQDINNAINATRTYTLTSALGDGGTWLQANVNWTDGETAVPNGVSQVTLTVAPPTPSITDDITGQTLYGIETFELLDLISVDSALFSALATRVLATRGHVSMPRIESVALAAESGDINTMELMATCRPELPSRYLCRLQNDQRTVFAREMFATGVRHFLGPKSWTLNISLDDAAWAAT